MNLAVGLYTRLTPYVSVCVFHRDPVHDFGFFRFDPSRVKFLDLHEIPLAPEGAKGIALKHAASGSPW